MTEENNKVRWVYSSRSNRDLVERYDQWAADYDKDLSADFDYLGPRLAAEVFARYVARDARVLDAGAGTGLVGEVLAGMGYGNIEAMDLSSGMLEEARKKGVYRALHQMVMGETLGFETAIFDAVICVGTLTVAHAPASSLDELVRVTRAGGYVAYTLRPDVYLANGFKEKHAALEAAGKWESVEVGDAVQIMPKGEPDVMHQVWLYRVL
jgi:ubiquinone/menaquinone biosynthesis C-methylase UbiE